MKSHFNTSLGILQTAQIEGLYHIMLRQVKKDFALANTELKILDGPEPQEFKELLREKIYVLLLEKFQQYLNLLYVVDVSENEITKMNTLDAVDASAKACFLILKREWQKVWSKHKHSS